MLRWPKYKFPMLWHIRVDSVTFSTRPLLHSLTLSATQPPILPFFQSNFKFHYGTSKNTIWQYIDITTSASRTNYPKSPWSVNHKHCSIAWTVVSSSFKYSAKLSSRTMYWSNRFWHSTNQVIVLRICITQYENYKMDWNCKI